MRSINQVILHCTATTPDRELTVQEIRNWHVKGNGWSDIGYHFLIHQDGTIEKGRPIHKMGAHTWGNNQGSIGVAYCGGVIEKTTKKGKKYVPKDTMTKEQESAFRELFKILSVIFGELKLRGHNDYTEKKSCPSFKVNEKFGDIKTI
jgi:N-acetylmuramoyl-L-alanine amidase